MVPSTVCRHHPALGAQLAQDGGYGAQRLIPAKSSIFIKDVHDDPAITGKASMLTSLYGLSQEKPDCLEMFEAMLAFVQSTDEIHGHYKGRDYTLMEMMRLVKDHHLITRASVSNPLDDFDHIFNAMNNASVARRAVNDIFGRKSLSV